MLRRMDRAKRLLQDYSWRVLFFSRLIRCFLVCRLNTYRKAAHIRACPYTEILLNIEGLFFKFRIRIRACPYIFARI